MKFGGTSVGNPDRMRSMIPLIDGEEKDCSTFRNVGNNKQPG